MCCALAAVDFVLQVRGRRCGGCVTGLSREMPSWSFSRDFAGRRRSAAPGVQAKGGVSADFVLLNLLNLRKSAQSADDVLPFSERDLQPPHARPAEMYLCRCSDNARLGRTGPCAPVGATPCGCPRWPCPQPNRLRREGQARGPAPTGIRMTHPCRDIFTHTPESWPGRRFYLTAKFFCCTLLI